MVKINNGNDFEAARKCYNCMNYMLGDKSTYNLRQEEFEFLYYYNKIHDQQKRLQILNLIKAIGSDEKSGY